MPSSRPETLRQALRRAGVAAESVLDDGVQRAALTAALNGTCLGARRAQFSGKSVLVAVETQLEAALALIDLDGYARKLVLLPPDVDRAHLPAIVRDAEADAIVCAEPTRFAGMGLTSVTACSVEPEPMPAHPPEPFKTEWLILTSGTTGDPKIAVHNLMALTGAIACFEPGSPRPFWSTFYDIRRYGGLQIFLRAMFNGSGLVLSRPGEAVADHIARLAAAGVTHVSGTPTHWRRALMSSAVTSFKPVYVRLSGEIADQAILDALRAAFPQAAIGHAYASTEAGVGFDVTDGLEGFPAAYLDAPRNGVEMKISDGSLRIRSNRAASGYAGRPDLMLRDAEGWVDTGDMIELSHERCTFAGRRGGIINVGGLKVHPEEIETLINRHAAVRQSRVRSRKSPIIGAIVVADVVLNRELRDGEDLQADILAFCRSHLPSHKVPAMVNVVPSIAMTAGGKVSRQHA
jgi:acyl-CoA synthetase (AMP-forming)/AMP-acid ligase II